MSEQRKIVICGSVDDGKSSLIGRILFDTKNIFDDQKNQLANLSKRFGTRGAELDLALLLDGLQDEREQGITIDVAHRFIDYKNERIVFCDSPGHKQYTKNVVTAASNCKIAVILLDASKGLLDQTKRHIKIIDFVGIRNVIFSINKIDLVKNKKEIFLKLKNKLLKLIFNLNFSKTVFVPTSAIKGDNVVYKSKKIKWYNGKSLLDEICDINISTQKSLGNFLIIRNVNRADRKIRHYQGILIGKKLVSNNKVLIFPGKKKTVIKKIYNNFKSRDEIKNGSYASLDILDKIDINRGDIIATRFTPIYEGNVFHATIIVTSLDKIINGREYFIKIYSKVSKITIINIKNTFDFEKNKETKKQKTLNINEFGDIEFVVDEIIAYSNFLEIKELSRFILIDKENFNVVAAGRINFALRRSQNIFKTFSSINKELRSKLKKQSPKCIWLTGLSGSGKTTIAQDLENKLHYLGIHTYVLDGDNLRSGINKDLGFSESDRVENIRRIAEISKLMVDAGLVVIVSAISPFKRERNFAKSLFEKNEFYEIYINTPLKECLKRDPKGIYKKSKKISSFNKIGLTGIYEKPLKPFLKIDTSKYSAENSVKMIFNKIFNFS
jgi:bifunctional enzyme CysN/CysC